MNLRMDLRFHDHLINITLQLTNPKRVSKKPKLLLPNRIIHIENNARSKRRDIEAIHLLLTQICFNRLEKMRRNLRSDQKGDVFIDQIECEDTPELGILLAQQHNRAFEEAEETADDRNRRFDYRRGAAAIVARSGGEDELGDEKSGEEEDADVHPFSVVVEIHYV